MLGLRWRPNALAQFDTLIAYVASDSLSAAQRLKQRILDAIEPARLYPEMFRAGRVTGTREIVAHPNYVVVYRVMPGYLDVVAVVHARQKYPSGDRV